MIQGEHISTAAACACVNACMCTHYIVGNIITAAIVILHVWLLLPADCADLFLSFGKNGKFPTSRARLDCGTECASLNTSCYGFTISQEGQSCGMVTCPQILHYTSSSGSHPSQVYLRNSKINHLLARGSNSVFPKTQKVV